MSTPVDPPSDLTLPEDGSTTMRRVLGEYLKSTLAAALGFPLKRFDSTVADDYYRMRRLLRELLEADARGAVFAAIRRPFVSTLVRCIERELFGDGDVERLDAWLTELTATLGWELSASGAVPASGISLRNHPARVICLGSRLEVALERPRSVCFKPGAIAVAFEDGVTTIDPATLRLEDSAALTSAAGLRFRRPFYDIRDDLTLALVDNNPLSDVEAHPDKAGNAIDLGAGPPSEWVASLSSALELTTSYLPGLADEIDMVMQVLVPVGTSTERHVSASYAEAVGTAYLSLHPDPMTMAEALIHESCHNKLNALLRVDPLLENAFSSGHASPVRPDPRPLLGVLLAAHAFIPVARLYERMIAAGDPMSSRSGFRTRYRDIVAGNHDAVAALDRLARPTAVGAHLVEELRRWDDHFFRALLDTRE